MQRPSYRRRSSRRLISLTPTLDGLTSALALRAGLLVAALVFAGPALAAPTTLAVAGALQTAAGGPVTDGEYALQVAVYDAPDGGVPLFVEKFIAVPVALGRFALSLGANDPAAVLDDSVFTAPGPRYIGVQVGGEPELPRVLVEPTPRALHARVADVALGLDCTGCVASAALAPGAVTMDALAPGAVGAQHVAFTYAASSSKGGIANEALSAQQAANAVQATAADEALVAELALDVTCVGCIEPEALSPKIELVPAIPNIYAVLDDAGQPASAITPGEAITLSGSGFGAGPEVVAFESPFVPTGATSPTAITTEVPPGVALGGLVALSVRDPGSGLRSNAIVLPFKPALTTYGLGEDGAASVAGTVNLNTTALAAGRVHPDAAHGAVASISGATVTTTAPVAGIAAGDEVLVINLMGSPGALDNVGKHAFGLVESVAGDQITLYDPPQTSFGVGGNADLSGQAVMVQRVPHYSSLTVSGTLTVSPFDGSVGGVLALRVSGQLQTSGGGSLDVSGRGYVGGAMGPGNDDGGHGGQGVNGPGKVAGANGQQSNIAGSNGGAGGHAESHGGCGAGGGGHAASGEAGAAGASWVPGGDFDTLGGEAVGAPDLSAGVFFGGAGGGGGDNDGNPFSGDGGRGGGVALVFAAKAASLSLHADGEEGSAGDGGQGGCGYAMGGSGAGGTIWLVSDDAALADVTAVGGVRNLNGSDCTGDGTFRPYGGAGAPGRVRVDAGQLGGQSDPAAYLGP